MANARVVHPNLLVTDITTHFQDAVNSLPNGQLVKDDGLSLFEAVGALEIGDPKMDSGCIEFGDSNENGFDAREAISPAQVVWVIDELVRREVAWHQGYPLSQTLFTSIYLDKMLWPEPKLLDDARFGGDDTSKTIPSQQVLRAYCLGLVKCCHLTLSMVTSQHYYEEEDFSTQLYNRDLLQRFNTEDILSEMRKSTTMLKGLEWGNNRLSALVVRLEARMALLQMFADNASSPPQPPGNWNLLAMLDQWESTAHLGQEITAAFSIKLQRSLASSVPPRPTVAVDMPLAFNFLRQLVKDVPATFELFTVRSSEDISTAYWVLMSQSPQPSVYVRTLAQSFLNVDNNVLGRLSAKEFIINDLKALVLPEGPVLDPANDLVENPYDDRFRIAKQLDAYVAKVGPSHINELRSFCQNRSRVRRNLCHALLEWDGLQIDAEDLDGSLQMLTKETPYPYPAGEAPTFSYSLSSWVYHYKLIQLRLEIQMGFELSIYALHEHPNMYWYLSHVVGCHLGHVERISYFVNAHFGRSMEAERTLGFLYRHFSYLKAVDSLASALHRLFVVLQRHSQIPKLKHAYANDELRFELRMRPFQALSIPEPLSHMEMEELASLRSSTDKQLLEQAGRLSTTSKKAWEEVLRGGWHAESLQEAVQGQHLAPNGETSVVEREWTKDIKNCMKASIGSSIAITTVKNALEDSKGLVGIGQLKVAVPGPQDAGRFHIWWAVPQILR